MARPRRGSFPDRRRTTWEAGVGGTAAQGITAPSVGFLGLAVSGLMEGLTLLRTRGLFQAVLLSAVAAGDGFQGAWGIGRATDAAVLAGIGSVPTPITEQGWEGWLYWEAISIHAGFAGANDRNWDGSSQRSIVDSKAMRKLDFDSTFYAAFEVVEVGDATASLFLETRMLLALP